MEILNNRLPQVAILYICTGKYNRFFADFYKSAQAHLLVGLADVEYFVFTDDLTLQHDSNVHLLYKDCQGFPLDTLFRFKTFLTIEDELTRFDYIYFMNANALVVEDIGSEIFPPNHSFVGSRWVQQKPIDWPMFYPYERNKESTSYIAPFEKESYIHYMGGFYGAQTDEFLKMTHILAHNIDIDYEKGIIAIAHDQCHINHYFRSHTCKLLPTGYCIPEEWAKGYPARKIIFRNKTIIDPAFVKGSNLTCFQQFKKTLYIITRAIRWYI